MMVIQLQLQISFLTLNTHRNNLELLMDLQHPVKFTMEEHEREVCKKVSYLFLWSNFSLNVIRRPFLCLD